jgi:hypothetical protein
MPGNYRTFSHTRSGCGVRSAPTGEQLLCWGDPNPEYSPFLAKPPISAESIVKIDQWHPNVCALMKDGSAVCWGERNSQEAGPFIDLSVGGATSCGLKADGRVACFPGIGTPPYDDNVAATPRFAPTPTKRFSRVDDAAVIERLGMKGASHPPFRGPFGPTDDSVLGFREETIVLAVPNGDGFGFHTLSTFAPYINAVMFVNADADPHMEAVVIAEHTCKGPQMETRLCSWTTLLDWNGTALAEHPEAPSALMNASTAAEVRAILKR